MIQLNLLPGVKLEYIKAQRLHRLIIGISIVITAVSVAILVLLFGVDLAQKKHLSDLNRDIKSETSQLKSKPSINKILTVQNQLQSLTALHTTKPAASRLFTNYLNQVTPGAAAINSLHFDFSMQTATITGTADSLDTVNKYVDTLKFTTYTTDSLKTATNAFNNVVLSSFGFNSSSKDPAQAASYTINLGYDKNIFDITQNVNLSVPTLITTRSELQTPGDLFQAKPQTSTPGGKP